MEETVTEGRVRFRQVKQKKFCNVLKIVKSQLPSGEMICKIPSPKIQLMTPKLAPFSFKTRITCNFDRFKSMTDRWFPTIRLFPSMIISQVLWWGDLSSHQINCMTQSDLRNYLLLYLSILKDLKITMSFNHSLASCSNSKDSFEFNHWHGLF